MSEVFSSVFALYPRVTQLDFTGPFEIFARVPGGSTHTETSCPLCRAASSHFVSSSSGPG